VRGDSEGDTERDGGGDSTVRGDSEGDTERDACVELCCGSWWHPHTGGVPGW
jgi:hypothetical protein